MTKVSTNMDLLPGKVAIFTISSNNYIPYTNTLLKSSLAHHAGIDHFLCLADRCIEDKRFYCEGSTLVEAHSLGIPEFDSFAFRYDIMELNTAVKPFMILYLFDLGYDYVIYFDPDIKVYRQIDPVFQLLREGASAVFTPHITRPAEQESPPDDISFMRAGIYNLGFLALAHTDQVYGIVRWWSRRLRYQCVNAQDEGIFVDQKFMDLVPGFLDDVRISRDPSLNVAYWNLFQRDLRLSDTGWTVDDEDLKFFHFSGFDPRNSNRLSKHTPMFSSGNAVPLDALLADYQADLVRNGLGKVPRGNYAYGHMKDGAHIPTSIRRFFREQFLTWHGNPFENFSAYLAQPSTRAVPGQAGAYCTNLMQALWDGSPYLQQTYRLDDSAGVTALSRWFLEHAHEAGVDERYIAPVAERISSARQRGRTRRMPDRTNDAEADVSVIGYLTTDTGVGEVGRLTLKSLSTVLKRVEGLDVSINVASSRNNYSCAPMLAGRASGRVNIFNINADQLPLVQAGLVKDLRADAYRIAIPFWELARFPSDWESAFDNIDEIWAPTRFIQTSLLGCTRKRVLRMPIALRFDAASDYTRDHYSLPSEKFTFLFSFDFLSFSGRKNPLAVVRAFSMAFTGSSRAKDVVLAIKCVNSGSNSDFLALLRKEVPSDLDIRIINRALSRAEMLGLIGVSDCVVSLHRSEGLGLLVAEAMALGVPVIATDYSATTELISAETGFPVDYKLVPLQAGDYPHSAHQVWAEPDLVHAAWQMRVVVDSAGNHGPLIERARQHLKAEYGLESVQRQQQARLVELGL